MSGRLPWLEYAESVVSGERIACVRVKQACSRFLRDLEIAEERGWYFDDRDVWGRLRFLSYLRHSKGRWAGTPFVPEPWQAFIIANIFGFKWKANNKRRFRTGYISMGRKNGKTFFGAGLGLLFSFADGEPGAEGYTAATKRDQARLSHAEATRMVRKTPALKRRITIKRDNLSYQPTNSSFVPLGADADSCDGLNVHFALVDELHAHKSPMMWEVITTATGAREQPFVCAITTAGLSVDTVCGQQYELSCRVLEGMEDDTHFAFICELDPDDDWQDESLWIKANPNLGVSVFPEDLRVKAARAKSMPSMLGAFLRLHMNRWSNTFEDWIPYDRWRDCGDPFRWEILKGRECYGGLDLSSVRDLTAFCLAFPSAKNIVRTLTWFWIPEDNVQQRVQLDGVPYDDWIRRGFVSTTPGDVIDYDYIAMFIEKLADLFDIRLVAYDPWRATEICNKLGASGIQMVEMRQGYKTMGPAMATFEALVLSRRLRHGGNPALDWNVRNLVPEMDPTGLLKPSKRKSKEKIDGAVANIEACELCVRNTSGLTAAEVRLMPRIR